MVFLFTDIAGAVDLKTRLGDAEAARLILRHDALFHRAISLAESGEVAQDTGDGFLAQFATASDAVQAALRFQHDIHTEPWGNERIQVRTGIHLGEVTGGEQKLIGLAKDIAARLMGLAIPGQILLSRPAFDSARQYVREHPGIDSSESPPELRWMDHGAYLFKGAEEPMHVFEVGAEGIAGLKAPPNSEKAKRADAPRVTARSEPAIPGQSRRNVGIGRDAAGNLLITGDGNIVIINTVPQVYDEPEEETVKHRLGPNPYRGLLAFQEEHAHFMFGRSRLIERLWKKFRDLHNEAPSDEPMRLLPIIGPSGCGKSSLVRAGLLPEFAAQPFLGIERATVAILTPGAHPVEQLARALARVATNEKVPLEKAREFEDELNRVDKNGKHCGLRRIAGFLPNLLNILFIDQFEDIYTQCKERSRRQTFVENLLHACADPGARLSVILCLRSDFLAETPENLAFNNVIAANGVIVPEMIAEQTRRAIREPARLAGHPLDDATVEVLLAQTEERPGALGLLQFALKSIWEGLPEVPPITTLRRIGGVGGSLAREAQRIYDNLSPDDRVIAQRCFVELAQIGAEGTRVTRRRVSLDSLVLRGNDPADVRRVLNRFATPAARLIALSADAEGPVMAEVTHEAIFERWRLLQQWLESTRDDRQLRHRLDQAAQHWRVQERPDGSLWRPPDLDLLRDYHNRAPQGMNSLQFEFFTASDESEVRRLEKNRRDEEILEEKRELIRTVLERSPTGMLIYDEHGQCVSANAAAAELVGLPQAVLQKQNYHEFESWRKMGMVVLADRAFRTGEIPSDPIDFPKADVRVPSDGQFVLIRSSGRPHLLLMMRDNTAIRQAKQIHELTQVLSATPGFKDILFVIINSLRATLDADRATIFEYDTTEKVLFTTVAHGLTLPATESGGEDSSEPMRLPTSKGLAGESFRTRAIINVPEAYTDERFNQEFDKITGYRTESILTIPLITHEGEIVGVAQVLNKRGRPFDTEDERIAEVLCAEAAAAIKRGQLIETQLAEVEIETKLRSKSGPQPQSQD